MNITVFGIGYVGLVQAAVLADVGHEVVCIDVDAGKVAALNEGVIPIHEPGLDRLVTEALRCGRLRFSTDAELGAGHGQVIFIAVGTPPDETGAADLEPVLAVADAIGRNIDGYRVVVSKSTVPVGTADRIAERIEAQLGLRERRDIHFDVVSNPEFLKEGSAVADSMRPDRIVIGTESPEAERHMRELYYPFNRNRDRMLVMDVRSAELTKYTANCLLATKISLMNEIANLAEVLGADIERVRQGVGSDPRIGYDFIYAGAGYGGSCFPKDIRALIRTAESTGIDARILKAVETRNDEQKSLIFAKVAAHYGGKLRGRSFALWGLAFKPNTDDMREAPSRALMEALWASGATVRAFDPVAMERCRGIYGERDDLMLCATQEEALEGADALLIVTDWKCFKAPSFDKIKRLLKEPVIFDGRNLYDPQILERYGFLYFGIGRNGARAAALQQHRKLSA